jgi:hypothetical protein
MHAYTRNHVIARHLGLLALLVAALVPAGGAGADDWPRHLEGHAPLAPDEHPRLIVRAGPALDALRAKADTPWGGKVVARMSQALRLTEKLAVTGRNREVLKEAGFKAAGYASRYLLAGEAKDASRAGMIVLDEIAAYPMNASLPVMDRCSRLQGAAFAYDLAFAGWTPEVRKKVRQFLFAEADRLLDKVGGPDADQPRGEEHICVCATAGLVALATAGDVENVSLPLDACEQAVVRYLREQIGEHGFGRAGESPRQAAFASGVLPFARANALVRGRDLTDHPAVAQVLTPMVYQVVPGVGMAVTGEATAAIDRTGLFAMSIDLTPESRRPAARWLFDVLGGERYLGVVRPHQGLYVLLTGLDDVSPQAPNDWPRLVRSEQARFAVYRSRWDNADDLLAVLHGRGLRVLGRGAQWAANACIHAGLYSHDRVSGRLDNTFLPAPGIGKTTVYKLNYQSRLGPTHLDEDGRSATLTQVTTGSARRIKPTLTYTKRVKGKKTKFTLDVPPGGDFRARRVIGVDATGRCGAPGLVAVADELTGAGQAPRVWVLHAGLRVKIDVADDGRQFTLTGPDTTCHGTVLVDGDIEAGASSNAPYANFLTLRTEADRLDVIMTIQPGRPPKVSAGAAGLAGQVRVGKQTVQLKEGRFHFGR